MPYSTTSAADRTENDWRSLKRNAERNRELFARAGLADDQVQTLRCPRCGCWERAYFWTAVRQNDSTAVLECPGCGEYRIRYDLGANRVTHPFGLRLLTTLALTGAVLLAAVLGAYVYRPDEVANLAARGREEVVRLFPATEWLRAEPSSAWQPPEWVSQVPNPPGGSPGLTRSAPASPRQRRAGMSPRSGREAARRPAVFIAEGDRRAELARSRSGTEVWYDTAAGRTWVRVEPGSAELRRALESDPAWVPAGSSSDDSL